MFLVSLILWTHDAGASNLIGNPTFRLPWFAGDAVDSAPIAALNVTFEGVHGQIATVWAPPCDLAVACLVHAPFPAWTRATVVVPSGLSLVTADGQIVLAGPNLVRWVGAGVSWSVEGPEQDLGAMLMVVGN